MRGTPRTWHIRYIFHSSKHNISTPHLASGVFLYLLPMGSGQSKGDNYHHWGYPMHSFWCCYGTAIESFAKLADSIYFHTDAKVRLEGGWRVVEGWLEACGATRPGGESLNGRVKLCMLKPKQSHRLWSQGSDPAKLYVNQLVSSSLNWRTMSTGINMTADMYAPGADGRRIFLLDLWIWIRGSRGGEGPAARDA